MIISIEAEKALEKSMIRTLSKLEKEEIYLKLTRNVYKNSIANTIPHGGRLHAFFPKIKKRARISTFIILIQQSTGGYSPCNKASKRNKRHTNGKRRNKIVPNCRCHNCLCRNPKKSTNKLLELISDFSKVLGYTINTEKATAFLYTNNKHTETKIKKYNTIYNYFKENDV